MREILNTHGGGAITRRAHDRCSDATAASPARGSQLEAAGKPVLAEPYLDLGRATLHAHQQRYEVLGELIHKGCLRLARAAVRWSESCAARYLAQATDLADLERRQQRLLRGDMPHLVC